MIMPSLKQRRIGALWDFTPAEIAIIRSQVRAELLDARNTALARAKSLNTVNPNAPTPETIANAQPPEIDRQTKREHWTKITQLKRLLDDDFIEREVFQCATAWLNDFEVSFGAGQSRDPSAESIKSSGENGQFDRQLAALDRVRAAREIVGDVGHEMLVVAVAEDWAWTRVGRHFGVTHHTARAAACAVLKQLFDDTPYGDRLRSIAGHDAVRVRSASFG